MSNIQISSSSLGNVANSATGQILANATVHSSTSILVEPKLVLSQSSLKGSDHAKEGAYFVEGIANTSPLLLSQDLQKDVELTESTNNGEPTVKKVNAQTGPKSAAGKKAIRFNALKTGRHAKSPLLPFEDEKVYAKHIKSVYNALVPTNYIESQIADDYANTLWKIFRHETRGAYEREKILERLTPQMAAQMLGIEGKRAARAPEYLTQLKHVVRSSERQLAKTGLQEYAHLIQNARGIQNFNLVWRQYPALFQALADWMKERQIQPALLGPTAQGLSISWQQQPNRLLSYLEEVADQLYYLANWELMRPQIRVWMEAYYFSQRAEQHRINQDEQLLLKERNYANSLLDRLMRQRRSGFLWSASKVEGAL